MWRSCYNDHITPVHIDNDRIIGVQFRTDTGEYLYIFQVYSPSSNYDIRTYREHLECVQDIISGYADRGRIILMGDFNSHLQGKSFIKPNDTRSHEMLRLLSNNQLVAVDTLPICTGSQSSFVSYDGKAESLIDHILVPVECIDLIMSCHIIDDECINVSTHRPIVATLTVRAVEVREQVLHFRHKLAENKE